MSHTQTPRTHRIAVIGGDGIGPEVTAEALKVLRTTGVALDTTDYNLGGTRYLRDGEILSDATLEEQHGFDALLVSWKMVGTPDVPPGVIERGLLLKIRFELDLYVNLRPFVGTAPGGTVPHDFVVIRENTEGPYVGEGGVLRRGTPYEVATQGSVNTRAGVERCVRYAFELAAGRGRQHLTLAHKTNSSPSPGTCGNARSAMSRPFSQRSGPRTTTSTLRASTSCRTRNATTSS